MKTFVKTVSIILKDKLFNMKIFKLIILLIIFFVPFSFASAESMASKTKGRVLLQKDVRMAWYVDPSNMKRHKLSNPNDALQLIQKAGLGISNKDFNVFNPTAPERLAGKILIKVHDNGRAYYVNPIDLKLYFLGDPKNALIVLRELGKSINDSDLEKIKIFKDKKLIVNEIRDSAANIVSNVKDFLDKGLVSVAGSIKEVISPVKTPDAAQGIYLTASTFKNIDLDAFIERNKDSHLNTVVVDVAGFGLLYYNGSRDNPELVKRIQKIKDAGFYFVARVVALKNTELARISPFKTKWGEVWNGIWVDGSTQEIKDYYVDVVKRLAKIGVDEVQLDYIRFPTEYYSRQTPQSREDRTKIITDLVRATYEQTQKENIKLSIDIFGILAWNEATNIKRLGQDTAELIKYVDYISPMIYPSHFSEGFGGFVKYDDPYTTILVSTRKFIEIIGEENKDKLRPWIQGFSYRAPNFGSNYIYAQVKALLDLGVDDFLVWNANNSYAATHGMFATLKALDKNEP